MLFVARSAEVSAWASDVGFGKHVFWLGAADLPAETKPKAVALPECCGATDWKIVAQHAAADLDFDAALAKVQAREKMIDPALYPRLRGARGLFKVAQTHVENHMVLARALAGAPSLETAKPKPADFAAYLLTLATRSS